MASILALHGPNLNLLGTREPDIYGHSSLEDINDSLKTQATQAGFGFAAYQSNAEHELIELIHASPESRVSFIIFNPAAFTHTSVALRDALLGVQIPFIEIHLSNIYTREDFRHHSYFSDVAVGIISGFGAYGYEMALKAAINWLNQHSTHTKNE